MGKENKVLEYDGFYKNLSKSANFIVLVADRVILIINDKLAGHAAELAEFINSSNQVGLKKKHLIWNELVKNYSAVSTSLINMIAFDHTINYARKNMLRELSAGKKADYIKSKIDSLDNACVKFIEQTKVFLEALNYIAKNLDFVAPSKEIKNLGDVHNLVNQALETISKKHYPKVQQLNTEILEKISKEGSFEITPSLENVLHNSLKQFSIRGGFEKSEYYQLVIGAKDEPSKVTIGGFHIDSYLKQQFVGLQLIKDTPVHSELFVPKLEKYLELRVLSKEQLFRRVLMESGALNNLFDQFSNLVTNIIPKLLEYHSTRFASSVNTKKVEMKFAVGSDITQFGAIIDYEDEYGAFKNKIEWAVSQEGSQIAQPIQMALKTVRDIFALIDKADMSKIMRNAKEEFKQISRVTAEEFEKNIQTLEAEYALITAPDFSFESRGNAKQAIKQKISIIQNSLSNPIMESSISGLPLVFDSPTSTAKDIENLIKVADYVISLESVMAPKLKEYETFYDRIVSEIYNLTIEIDTLISPDNKHTCIKRPTLIIITGLRAVMLDHLWKKRFSAQTGVPRDTSQIRVPRDTSQIELEKIILHINTLLESDVHKFYDTQNGLNLNEIEKTIKETVGFVN